MQDAKKYREYAVECRRMAERARGDDKQALLNIAEAWERQAQVAEAQRNKQ